MDINPKFNNNNAEIVFMSKSLLNTNAKILNIQKYVH